MAAAVGNQYAAKAKQWQMSIERALDKRGAGDRTAALDKIADKLLTEAEAGEQWAVIELGNRLDGKPAQTISGPDGGPLIQINLAPSDGGL